MLRQITISPCLNGFIATVGCQQLAFDDRTKMLLALDEYLMKPDEVEKRYRQNALHKELLVPTAPPPECNRDREAVCGAPTTLGGAMAYNQEVPPPIAARRDR